MATSGSAQLPVEVSVPSRVSTPPVTKVEPRHSGSRSCDALDHRCLLFCAALQRHRDCDLASSLLLG